MAIGASTVTVVQAAVSALYLVVVAPSTGQLVPFRFIDALVGGAVAVVASQLVSARRPLAPLVAEAQQTFGDLAGLVDEINDALARKDEAAARAALARARGMDAAVDRLETAVLAAGEALRLDVRRRRHIDRVRAIDASTRQVDYAVRNVRVLARAAVTLTRLPAPAPPELVTALRSLSDAVRTVGRALAADLTGDGEVRRPVRRRGRGDRAGGRTGRGWAAQPGLPVPAGHDRRSDPGHRPRPAAWRGRGRRRHAGPDRRGCRPAPGLTGSHNLSTG